MDLRLSVPEPLSEIDAVIKTEPDELRRWLEGLPLLNITETGPKIFEALQTTNRLKLPADERVQLLELYRSNARLVCDALHKHYAGLSLPLTPRHKVIASQVKDYATELAYGYKRVILDIAQSKKRKLKYKHGLKLALPIQRAIRHLSKVLVHAYEFYTPYPVGTLREIHELFRFGEGLGVISLPVDDPLNDALTQSSISHAYKQALLLDLSDPYHLPAHMIRKVDRFLDRWAPLANISPATSEPGANCQFLIDLQSDRAGEAYVGDNKVKQPEQHRLLHTLELARTLHNQLALLKQGKTPADEGLGQDFFNPSTKDMFKRLINTWGLNPKRIFPRNTQLGGEIRVVIGLPAINYFVNHEHRFVTSAKHIGPQPKMTSERKGADTIFLAQDQSAKAKGSVELRRAEDKQKKYTHATWQILDESAGGLALGTKYNDDMNIKVGDLIATQVAEQNGGWSIAIIRWMKFPGPNQIEIGTQRLAPRAKAVAIKVLRASTDKQQESDFMYALILPEISTLKQKQSLAVPRGTYQSDQLIYIDDGESLQRIKSARLVEVTGSIERFEYTLVDHSNN